eukprot:TRINITY_DN5052_c0_g1_i1.p1 TRINITY_DN5052_c0_g1~~TRINITY_DN5052_c0_g1_i1.p1  ORF type:complete len:686 (-),score=140.81 TRINITY_DN5052_c0_g1_i1:149-2206(-)
MANMRSRIGKYGTADSEASFRTQHVPNLALHPSLRLPPIRASIDSASTLFSNMTAIAEDRRRTSGVSQDSSSNSSFVFRSSRSLSSHSSRQSGGSRPRKFDLAVARKAVFRQQYADGIVPRSVKKFFADPLFDNLLSTCVQYCTAIVNLRKIEGRKRRATTSTAWSGRDITEFLSRCQMLAEANVKERDRKLAEVSALYTQVVFKYHQYTVLPWDHKSFYDAITKFIYAVTRSAFDKSHVDLVQSELDKLFREGATPRRSAHQNRIVKAKRLYISRHPQLDSKEEASSRHKHTRSCFKMSLGCSRGCSEDAWVEPKSARTEQRQVFQLLEKHSLLFDLASKHQAVAELDAAEAIMSQVDPDSLQLGSHRHRSMTLAISDQDAHRLRHGSVSISKAKANAIARASIPSLTPMSDDTNSRSNSSAAVAALATSSSVPGLLLTPPGAVTVSAQRTSISASSTTSVSTFSGSQPLSIPGAATTAIEVRPRSISLAKQGPPAVLAQILADGQSQTPMTPSAPLTNPQAQQVAQQDQILRVRKRSLMTARQPVPRPTAIAIPGDKGADVTAAAKAVQSPLQAAMAQFHANHMPEPPSVPKPSAFAKQSPLQRRQSVAKLMGSGSGDGGAAAFDELPSMRAKAKFMGSSPAALASPRARMTLKTVQQQAPALFLFPPVQRPVSSGSNQSSDV